MMSAFVSLVSLMLFCQVITACDESQKTVVNVDIYYETLCPHSIIFFDNQLMPNYDTLKEHLSVNLIPFGKATYKEGVSGSRYQFDCQHGAKECNGNRAQACGLSVIANDSLDSEEERQKRSVEFTGCIMSKYYMYDMSSIETCGNQIELSGAEIKDIIRCTDSVMGDQLLASHGDKTTSLSPKLTFVPTIVVNNVYSKENQSMALKDFRGLICGFLSNDCDAPSFC